MRNFLSLLFLIVLCHVLCAATWHDDESGYTWIYELSANDEAIIENRSLGTAEDNFVCAVSPAPNGNLEVPLTIAGHKVVSIGRRAFLNCGNLKTIQMPNTVTNLKVG